jgi:hypothetical protein
MTTRMSPIGLVGRSIAVIGILLVVVSIFQQPFTDNPGNFRELYERADIALFVLTAAAIVLLLVSLFAGQGLSLYVAGMIGAVVLGYFVFLLIEFKFEGFARGWYLATAGATCSVVGTAVALTPMLLARGEEPELAFLSAEPAAAPEAPPAAAAEAPPAGWYADPSGQARLRYWDGETWSEQTQQ